MMTMQTRLGEKIKILSDRVMELWEGRADGKKVGEKKGGNGANANAGGNGAVKVSQPIAGNALWVQQHLHLSTPAPSEWATLVGEPVPGRSSSCYDSSISES